MPQIIEKKNLRELAAEEVMHKGCISIRSDATLADAIKKMKKAQVSSLVVEPRWSGDVHGIISRRDILHKAFVPGAKRVNFSETKVYDLMTKPFVSVPPKMKVKYAARLMKRYNVHRLPVVSNTKVVGMISDSDVFKRLF